MDEGAPTFVEHVLDRDVFEDGPMDVAHDIASSCDGSTSSGKQGSHAAPVVRRLPRQVITVTFVNGLARPPAAARDTGAKGGTKAASSEETGSTAASSRQGSSDADASETTPSVQQSAPERSHRGSSNGPSCTSRAASHAGGSQTESHPESGYAASNADSRMGSSAGSQAGSQAGASTSGKEKPGRAAAAARDSDATSEVSGSQVSESGPSLTDRRGCENETTHEGSSDQSLDPEPTVTVRNLYFASSLRDFVEILLAAGVSLDLSHPLAIISVRTPRSGSVRGLAFVKCASRAIADEVVRVLHGAHIRLDRSQHAKSRALTYKLMAQLRTSEEPRAAGKFRKGWVPYIAPGAQLEGNYVVWQDRFLEEEGVHQ